MSKLSIENKINIYEERKCGKSINYLSPILDGCNGEIVSHNISKSPNLKQINDMLDKGFKGKNLEILIFHSDQGW